MEGKIKKLATFLLVFLSFDLFDSDSLICKMPSDGLSAFFLATANSVRPPFWCVTMQKAEILLQRSLTARAVNWQLSCVASSCLLLWQLQNQTIQLAIFAQYSLTLLWGQDDDQSRLWLWVAVVAPGNYFFLPHHRHPDYNLSIIDKIGWLYDTWVKELYFHAVY